jgi:hypothetical protein
LFVISFSKFSFEWSHPQISGFVESFYVDVKPIAAYVAIFIQLGYDNNIWNEQIKFNPYQKLWTDRLPDFINGSYVMNSVDESVFPIFIIGL